MHGWCFFTTVAHPAIGSTRFSHVVLQVVLDDGNDRVGSRSIALLPHLRCACLNDQLQPPSLDLSWQRRWLWGVEDVPCSKPPWRSCNRPSYMDIWSVFSILVLHRSTTTDQLDRLGRQLLWPCWPSPTTARGKTAAGPGPRQRSGFFFFIFKKN